ncbi:MAG TPA: hypothetical protein ENK86_04840 [Campylobacterales bacterium]|nr:hypothetical protein [Campylobacterales bacterium]
MEFLHHVELEIRAFFFNAQTDYLPYYKHFSLTLSESDQAEALKTLLPKIKAKNPMFSYPDKDLLFRVNGLVVTGEELLREIIDQLGTELTIEPALSFRSDNGLIINNHDFMHQYRSVFERHYADKEDLEYYLSLYPVHYASESFNYNRDYIGDAILITAARMIERHPENQEEILEAINDEFNGIVCCEYENNLFNGEDYSDVIESLKQALNLKAKRSLMETLTSKCLKAIRKPTPIETLEGKRIALYVGYREESEIAHQTLQTIETLGKAIHFEMEDRRAGQSLMEINPMLALQKAGKMLLQALDNGAEVLVCLEDDDAECFLSVMGEIENAMGREIELGILSLSRFQEMSNHVEA